MRPRPYNPCKGGFGSEIYRFCEKLMETKYPNGLPIGHQPREQTDRQVDLSHRRAEVWSA
jgi:hypothetical protein